MTTTPAMCSVSTMFAACPACKTVFPVSAAQLRAAGGRVRCGNCEKIFTATDTLFNDPQQALGFATQQLNEVSREIDDLVDRALDAVPLTEAAGSPLEADVPTEPEVHQEPAVYEQPEPSRSRQPDSAGPDLVDIALGALHPRLPADVEIYATPVAAEFVPAVLTEAPVEQEPPSFAPLFDTSFTGARTSWGAIAAALFLTLLLLGQYTWAERDRLAAIPAFRPMLTSACTLLGCDLPLQHATARLEVLEREIRNHPNVDDALLVSATFVNGADFVQSYPIFEVAFSDVSGTPVAVRRFLPSEYLNDIDPSTGMEPGQQTQVLLEIVDPGKRAVSFQFNFL